MKTLKQLITEEYGSINNFINEKLKEYNGELPLKREHIYKLLNHEIPNPGIKSLNQLAEIVKVDREFVYKEFSE